MYFKHHLHCLLFYTMLFLPNKMLLFALLCTFVAHCVSLNAVRLNRNKEVNWTNNIGIYYSILQYCMDALRIWAHALLSHTCALLSVFSVCGLTGLLLYAISLVRQPIPSRVESHKIRMN